MSTATTADRAALADLWRWFTTDSFGTYSPLYAAIGRGVAEDPELIEMTVEAGTAAAQFPLVLMAAVHELVLTDQAPGLDEIYAGRSDGDPFPPFRQACLDHHDALVARMATQTTQTNEVGRSALIAMGLAHVAGDFDRWALVEAGSSAGLNLRYDRYRLDFGEAGAVGDPASPVQIECRSVGMPLAVPVALPVPAERVGLDQDPVDLTDDDARRWLLACTWPDTGRMERTAAAHALVAADPPRLVTGDMVEDLPALLAATAPDLPVVVVTTWAFGYLTPHQRRAFADNLAAESRRRPVVWLSGEQPGVVADLPEVDATPAEAGTESSLLGAIRFTDGQRSAADVLAVVHPHGRWIDWRVEPGPRCSRQPGAVERAHRTPRRSPVFAVLGFIIFGLVVGIVARLIVPGTKGLGLFLTLAIGVVGSLIGGLVASWAGTGDIWELNIFGSIVAFASAAVLLAIVTAGNRRLG